MQPEARHLFSRTYAEARQKFLQAAASRGLSVDSHELPLAGADGELLATDVVLDGPADASKLVIVISGVHGVEGYCGSAVQTGLLGLGPVTEPDTAVLYVHAVNPHGFSHSRRETQENVDLNRNFIDFSAAMPVNGPYAAIHELLLPRQWPPTDDNELALFEVRREWGPKGFQRAVALGQYEFDDGMHFGGRGPTWSNATFHKILQRYGRHCQHLGSIDIHTGLGPYSVGERIFACLDEGVSLERARRWWGDVTSVHAGTSNSIPMTGPIQFALFDECSQAVQTNLCLEFGTYPTSQVIGASRAEHWLHRHGSSDPLQAAAIRQSLKDAFYPQADDWQQAIWQQGREVFQQTVSGLQED
ncbi:M14 family metallopeptidase [Cupriavidus sp. BIS7]|uniref:M14 family metallopeptidase n=1 Tax=Cupriavidus sp. BIS7 TaxID=1217718 RepID=UPI0003176280|nr:M14 family metallopeptidase [Cupriavidus sp. BIS7]